MIIVTGATGQLGTAFRRILGDRATYPTHAELDLTNVELLRQRVATLRPSLLINCAAYTAVDRAESEPEVAQAINATAVGVLAETMASTRGRFVTFSTDYVFDGTADRAYVESDLTHPINTYGATKHAGEIAALSAYPESLVIRTSWLLSGSHRNFAASMIQLARQGDVSVVDDQRGHPTIADDLAQSTLRALDAEAGGILHLANSGVTSWHDLAREILEYAGLDPNRIHACSTADYFTPAKRPTNSVIDSERLGKLDLEGLPHYGQGLRRAVEEILTWLA